MARRKTTFLEDLAFLPCWVSASLAVVVYVAFTYILPTVESESFIFKAMAPNLPRLATPFALLLLMPAGISAFNSWLKRGLLERQKGIDSVRSLGWREFEELVGEAFRRKGYRVIENTGAGPDGGIDIRLIKEGELTLVQCKHWKASKVSVQIVRELYGVMTAEGATNGIVVCSGAYTQDAESFARGKAIDLIDGDELLEVIGGVQKTGVIERTPACPSVTVTACPKCGNQMILREARRGQNAGQQFWGCSNYPKCRGTRKYHPQA